ncbi:hypothetical protein GCM10027452_20210 [Micromonospora halotolerans]
MPTTGAGASKSNFSAVPMVVLLAISGEVVLGAVTYLPLMVAFRLIVPSVLSTIWKVSQAPIEADRAISGFAPALSAVTNLLFARARSPTRPLPASTTSYFSHAPMLVPRAISGLVPALSAVT